MQYSSQQQPKSNLRGSATAPDVPQAGYRDPIWALVFLVNVVLVFVGAVLNYKNISFESGGSTSSPNSKAIIGVLVASFVGSIAFSNLWIRYLCRPSVASNIIKFAMLLNAAFAILGVIVAFAAGQVVAGVIALIMCGITLAWYYFVRNRIAFTAVMLEMAANCTREFASTVYIAIFMQFVSIIWAGLWLIAVLGVFPNGRNSNGLVTFLLLLSFYWTVNVVMNIVQVSVGGVAATWFYRSQTSNVVSSSMKRACTTSLGSICLGSFIVAAIEALRAVARSANQERGNAFVTCIVDCILGFIQWVAEFISKYAYAYVAIWGQDFCLAAKNTWSLFKSRGFDVIVNDDLSGLAFMLSALVGGIVGAIIAGLVAFAAIGSSAVVAGVFIGFFMGAFFTGIAMSVLDACVTTFFVLWAEDPSPLATNHPDLHQKLVAAVRKMYPNIQGPI